MENNINYKYTKTGILDLLIIVVSAILACVAYIFGSPFFAFILIAIATGFLAKTIAIKSFLISIISTVIPVLVTFLLIFLLKINSFSPIIFILSYIICGVILGLTVIGNVKRVTSIVLMSVVLVLIVIAMNFYSYYMTNATISFDGYITYIKSFFDDVKANLDKILSSQDSQIIEYAEVIFNMVKAISIGVIIMALEFVSILATVFFKLGIKMSHAEVVVPSDWKIEPNAIIARVYSILIPIFIVTYILTAFNFTAIQGVYVVIVNALLVLSPIFVIAGIIRLITAFSKRKTSPIIFVIIIFVMLFINPLFIVIMLSSIAASSIILKSKSLAKMSEDENKNNDNNQAYEFHDQRFDSEYRDNENDNDGYYNDNRDNSYDNRNEYDNDEYSDEYEEDYDSKFYGYKEKDTEDKNDNN